MTVRSKTAWNNTIPIDVEDKQPRFGETSRRPTPTVPSFPSFLLQQRNGPGQRDYRVLLALTLLVLISFAFPPLNWLGAPCYSLIALWFTRVLGSSGNAHPWSDRSYQALGLFAVVSQWMWLITPVKLESSGIPLVTSWCLLVGWSVIRLVRALASETKVNERVLMGAAAGYLHLGLTAGLVMGAVETIQHGSFRPLTMASMMELSSDSVLMVSSSFAEINYYAFVCLTTVGYGDINPVLPLARMLSIATSIIGPLYLAVVMGVLIGRFSTDLKGD